MIHVRMPEELKEMLTVSAKENSRSVTAEIINILENHFLKKSDFSSMSDEEKVAALERLSKSDIEQKFIIGVMKDFYKSIDEKRTK